MIGLFALAAFAIGCKKNNTPKYLYHKAEVRQTDGMNTVALGQTLTLSVVCVTSQCDFFHQFVTTVKDADTTLVTMMTKIQEGIACNYGLATVKADYRFQPKKRGTHYLKFLSNIEKGIYMTDTITVN